MISKPTVDILLEIDNETNIKQLTNILLDNGWLLMSSEENPCMRMVFNKGYTDAKSNFILKYTEKAKEEYGNKYNPQK